MSTTGSNSRQRPAEADAPPVDALIARRILILSNLLRRSAALRYRRLLDISVGEWGALAELGARPPCTLNELAAGLALDKTRLSRTVGGLVARGLIARGADPKDARASRLSLTRNGRRIYGQMMRSAAGVNEALLENLDADARAALFSSIETLTSCAKRLLEAEREIETG
jgi:DNA-binding MarR family transcriptional regulator